MKKETELGGFSGGGINYQIHLLGQVESPGTYRLNPSIRLDEAITKGGGIAERGSQRQVEVRRDGKAHRYDLFRFLRFGDLRQNPFLLDNDVVFVPYAGNSVAIRGPVKSDGVYELKANEKTVWDLVELAGGFTVGMSEKDPVTVVRFESGTRRMVKVPNLKTELEQLELLNGDIVIIPHFLAENRHFDYNILDLPADNIFYPTQKSEIYVTGAVGSSGGFPYNPTSSVRDFVNMAGPTELAKIDSAYVLAGNGTHIRSPMKKKNFRLSPGDTIVVPRRRVTTDNVLKWYGTVTSTVFTSFALKELLK